MCEQRELHRDELNKVALDVNTLHHSIHRHKDILG